MKIIKWLSIFLLTISLWSCKGKKVPATSFNGANTTEQGLRCSNVFLSNTQRQLCYPPFSYGTTFYMNFVDMEGFTLTDSTMFPGMKMSVVDSKGDTIMNILDAYESKIDGVKIEGSTLSLNAHITVGKPMHSNNEYTAFIKIWDKKSDKSFLFDMNFSVISNSKIEVKKDKGFTYKEAYLISESRGGISDQTIYLNESLYLMIQGLEGFKEDNGKVFIGLEVEATDVDGKIIAYEKDILGVQNVNVSDVKENVRASFKFYDKDIKGPITCQIRIWDKKTNKEVIAKTKLELMKIPE